MTVIWRLNKEKITSRKKGVDIFNKKIFISIHIIRNCYIKLIKKGKENLFQIKKNYIPVFENKLQ